MSEFGGLCFSVYVNLVLRIVMWKFITSSQLFETSTWLVFFHLFLTMIFQIKLEGGNHLIVVHKIVPNKAIETLLQPC